MAGCPFRAGLSVVTDYPGESTVVWMVASTVVGPMAASMDVLTVALMAVLMAVGPTVVSMAASMAALTVALTDVTTDGWRAVTMAATDSAVNATDSAVNATDSVGTGTSTGYDRPSTDHRPLGYRPLGYRRRRDRRGPLP